MIISINELSSHSSEGLSHDIFGYDYRTQIGSIICNIAFFYVHEANLGCFLQDTGPLSPVASLSCVTSFQSPRVLTRQV